MKIKICGIKGEEQLLTIDGQYRPDFLGMIFYSKSPRFVGHDVYKVKTRAKKVGVFVNEGVDEIKRITDSWELDFVQLHGNEPVELVKELTSKGIKVIKAISIGQNLPGGLADFEPYVEMFLMDTKTVLFGGSGRKFNWSLLENNTIQKPWLLSGGISPDDLSEIDQLNLPNMIGIDINSGFEISPGVKDFGKLKMLTTVND